MEMVYMGEWRSECRWSGNWRKQRRERKSCSEPDLSSAWEEPVRPTAPLAVASERENPVLWRV